MAKKYDVKGRQIKGYGYMPPLSSVFQSLFAKQSKFLQIR